MKILITGPSGISCDLGNRLGIISNITSLQKAHEELGHHVERRVVVPGENLFRFDRVYAIQQTIASWVAPFALGFLYTVGSRQDCVICFDDWQAPDSFRLGQAEKMTECAWNPKLNRKYQDEAMRCRDFIDRGIEILCSRNQMQYLLPIFPGGDYNRIPCNGVRVPYDPSPFMRQYRYVTDEGKTYAKRRRWILASLQDNSSWVNKQFFEWPVINYGVKKLGQQRVTEADLARIYASSWGVLSPPHRKLEGTGWFRVRVPMAIGANSIIYGPSADMSILFGNTIFRRSTIEEATETDLREIVARQKEEYSKRAWTKTQLLEFITNFDKR